MSQSTTNGEWTIGRLLNWTRERFSTLGLDEPRLSAELLLAHALGCKKIELYTRFEAVPDEAALSGYRDLVRRASHHEPIAYLLGQKQFFSLDFEVGPAVLIPRPETETLVQAAIDFGRAASNSAIHVLDAGTGSGCIAVAIATYLPDAHVAATDASPEALEVAGRNVARHNLQERVRLNRADWLDLPSEVVPAGGFDMIVSNPPYVDAEELNALPKTVRDFEPRSALIAGEEPLAAYRRLAADSPNVLRTGGVMIVEVGYGQADAVTEIFVENGRFELAGTRRDQAGLDRVVQFAFRGG